MPFRPTFSPYHLVISMACHHMAFDSLRWPLWLPCCVACLCLCVGMYSSLPSLCTRIKPILIFWKVILQYAFFSLPKSESIRERKNEYFHDDVWCELKQIECGSTALSRTVLPQSSSVLMRTFLKRITAKKIILFVPYRLYVTLLIYWCCKVPSWYCCPLHLALTRCDTTTPQPIRAESVKLRTWCLSRQHPFLCCSLSDIGNSLPFVLMVWQFQERWEATMSSKTLLHNMRDLFSVYEFPQSVSSCICLMFNIHYCSNVRGR